MRIRDLEQRARPPRPDRGHAVRHRLVEGRPVPLLHAPDDAWRSYQIWRHELATDAATDVLVFQEDDSHFDVGVDNTRNGQFVVINTESRTTSEVWLVDAADPLAPARLIAARDPGVEYSVDVQGDRLLIVTNLDAVDFRLVEAPVDSVGRDSWTDVLPHRPGVRLFGVDAFAGPRRRLRVGRRAADVAGDPLRRHAVRDRPARGRVLASPRARTPSTTRRRTASTTSRWSRRRRCSTSISSPASASSAEAAAGARRVRPGRATRPRALWADGDRRHQVPISLVRRRGLPRDGRTRRCSTATAPTSRSIAPWFSSPGSSLLDRGFVWALAHASRRRRARPALVPRRQAAAQAQHVHRLRRRAPSTSSPRAGRAPTAWRSGAPAPAGCSSGPR